MVCGNSPGRTYGHAPDDWQQIEPGAGEAAAASVHRLWHGRLGVARRRDGPRRGAGSSCRVLTFAWGEAVRMRAAASVALPGLWRASTTGAPCWASILGRVEADSGGGP